jgi:hypothetical protein
LLLAVAALPPLPAQPITPAQVWGAPSDGMRLAVWKSGSFSRATPEFYAALQNIGSEDALLNLGIMFAKKNVKTFLCEH